MVTDINITNAQYDFYYNGFPDDSLPPGTFRLTETPPPNVTGVTFSVALYQEDGALITALEATDTSQVSDPVQFSSLTGSKIIARLNYSGSGKSDVELSLPLSQSTARQYTQANIIFTWQAAASPSPQRSMVPQTGSDPPSTYFADFDGKNFLADYAWLKTGKCAFVTQTDKYAISGKYSCMFSKGLLCNSKLASTGIELPRNTTKIYFNFAAHINPGILFENRHVFDLKIDFEKVANTTTYPINLPKQGDPGYGFLPGWDDIIQEINVPAGNRKFDFNLNLITTFNQSYGDIIAIDNLAINFLGDPPRSPQKSLVYSDVKGGVFALDASQQEPQQPMWTFQAAGPLHSPPAVANGVIYFGNFMGSDFKFYALNARTGEELWSKSLMGSINATPVVVGNTVYYTTSDGYIHADYIKDGKEHHLPINVLNLKSGKYKNIISNFIVGNKAFIIAQGRVCGVDILKRRSLWPPYIKSDNFYTPGILSDDVIYVGGFDGVLYSIDVKTGKQKWAYDTGADEEINTIPVALNGAVIFGSDNGNVYCVDSQHGGLLWKLSFPNTHIRSLCLAGNRLYFADNSSKATMYCYSLYVNDKGGWTQHKEWQQFIPGGSQTNSIILGNLIYINDTGDKCYALNALDGSVVWTYDHSLNMLPPPAVVAFDPQTDKTRRYDQYCYLTAHNAFANQVDGWWLYAQQLFAIPEQLKRGVQALMLDVWKKNIDGVEQVVYDHDGWGNWLQFASPRWKPLTDSLREIKKWMVNNPNEILTIFLEQRVDDRNLLQKSFSDAGIVDMIFYADRPNQGISTTWEVATQGWPSLEWMARNNKRLIVFSDWHCDKSDGCPDKNDGFPWVYHHAVENHYGYEGLFSGCENRSASQPISDTRKSLFILNRFAENASVPIFAPVDIANFLGVIGPVTNNYYAVISKVQTCRTCCNRLPNFLAVDYFNYGAFGGPAAAVQKINEWWTEEANRSG